MNHSKPWHEDDGFWEAFAPSMFSSKRWEAVPEKVDELVALLGLDPGAAILDLACGPGRFSLELARRGYRMTAVDRTRAYLREAQERARTERLELEFVREDMRRFSRDESFNAAISIFTSFGYFVDPAEDRQVVVNVGNSLKRDGVFLLDVMGKEVLARKFQERDWEREEDGAIFLRESRICKNWSWIESQWTVYRDQRWHETTVSHRLYSATELSALLTDCGFGAVDIYGDLAGAPYDHQAKRLIAVARK